MSSLVVYWVRSPDSPQVINLLERLGSALRQGVTTELGAVGAAGAIGRPHSCLVADPILSHQVIAVPLRYVLTLYLRRTT